MRIVEVEEVMEAKMVWAKRGKKIVRKVRCTSGPRKGRLVSNASQCSKAINMKKRMVLKRTKARMGKRLSRISQRTKRMNPAARRLRQLNRR